MTSAQKRLEAALRQDLHDLSQPLTRLQWRLELGRRGGESELREAVDAALGDATELMEWVHRLRRTIAQEEAA